MSEVTMTHNNEESPINGLFKNTCYYEIPFFQRNKADYKGSATFIFWIGIIGFLLSIIAILFGKPIFVHFYGENSSLFIGYLFYLIPLLFFKS